MWSIKNMLLYAPSVEHKNMLLHRSIFCYKSFGIHVTYFKLCSAIGESGSTCTKYKLLFCIKMSSNDMDYNESLVYKEMLENSEKLAGDIMRNV